MNLSRGVSLGGRRGRGILKELVVWSREASEVGESPGFLDVGGRQGDGFGVGEQVFDVELDFELCSVVLEPCSWADVLSTDQEKVFRCFWAITNLAVGRVCCFAPEEVGIERGVVCS